MTDVMILAGGLGTRMKSRRAKVLHEIAGLPLVAHVVRAAFKLSPDAIFTVVGHQAEDVERAVRDQAARLVEGDAASRPELHFALQAEQRGTGHAVMAARESLASHRGPLIVLAGDGPMIKSETLRALADRHAAEHNDAT